METTTARAQARNVVEMVAGALGFLLGGILGLLLVIAYNTSSEAAVLEGGRAHVRFGGAIMIALFCAFAGLAGGWILGGWFARRMEYGRTQS